MCVAFVLVAWRGPSSQARVVGYAAAVWWLFLAVLRLLGRWALAELRAVERCVHRKLFGMHICNAPDTDCEWTCPYCGQVWRAGEPVPVWLRDGF
jgi:hypothetical protein